MTKKYFYFIFIILIINTSLTFSQEREAKIFFVNLFNVKVDIKLGKANNPVFTINKLEPFSASKMIKTNSIGKHQLYFKKSSNDNFNPWSDDGETLNFCNIERGKSYCIFVNSNGLINYFFLEEDQKKYAKVCFINGSDSLLSRMQISKYWDKNIAAYTENNYINTISNFVTIFPGNYCLFWQFPNQIETNKYSSLTNKAGNTNLVFTFRSNNYYVFLVYTKDRTYSAKLITITP